MPLRWFRTSSDERTQVLRDELEHEVSVGPTDHAAVMQAAGRHYALTGKGHVVSTHDTEAEAKAAAEAIAED